MNSFLKENKKNVFLYKIDLESSEWKNLHVYVCLADALSRTFTRPIFIIAIFP